MNQLDRPDSFVNILKSMKILKMEKERLENTGIKWFTEWIQYPGGFPVWMFSESIFTMFLLPLDKKKENNLYEMSRIRQIHTDITMFVYFFFQESRPSPRIPDTWWC